MKEAANPAALKERFAYMFESHRSYEFYQGWFAPFASLCMQIDQLLGTDKRGFHWLQIKEKMGTLRLHWTMDAAYAKSQQGVILYKRIGEAVVEHANASCNVCIVCGRAGSLDHHGGYVLTLCEIHRSERAAGTLAGAHID